MKRTDIIQTLIKKNNAKKYLEIGLGDGENFANIMCDYKIGVDPFFQYHNTIRLTSDQFFKENTEIFDIIFIDGLHWSKQVYRDIINSINCLSENGYIICHDMNPYNELIQKYPQEAEGEWTGDCWKALVQLRTETNDLQICVVDTDYGCGIISKGYNDILKNDKELTWKNFQKHKSEWLNLITIKQFNKLYGK
jgi:hypothetical protein